MTEPILQNRDREILRAVVDAFIQTGEPVASKTLAREMPDGCSSATIRNVMSSLEDAGLLAQPHTSAGRLPTDRGLRFYVEELLEPRPLAAAEQARINDALRSRGGELGPMLGRASYILADLSHNVGMVLIPDFSRRPFEKIDFVKIDQRRVAALFVSRPGMVEHRVVEVEEDYTQDQLDSISRFLSDSFRGLSLTEIRARILEMMSEEKAQYDLLMKEALSIAARSFGDEPGSQEDLIVEGATNILDEHAFDSVDKLKSLFQAFEEKSRLMSLLNRCLDAKGWRVFIGSEAGTPEMEGCSLIVAPYHDGVTPVGTVGILGPARMDYGRLVSLVESLGKALTGHVTGGERDSLRLQRGLR